MLKKTDCSFHLGDLLLCPSDHSFQGKLGAVRWGSPMENFICWEKASSQYPTRSWGQPAATWVSMKVDPLLVESSDKTDALPTWPQLHEKPQVPRYATSAFPMYGNYEMINACCFKPLHFGVICYIAIDKYYNYRLTLFKSVGLAIFQG